MTDKRPLSEVLTRLYFLGWVGLSPLVLIFGLIAWASYNWQFRYFLVGLKIGLVNLGILWTGIFLLIVIGHVVVSIMWQVYGLGWTILIVIGFISEFLAESYGFSGGLFAAVAIGFLPMTVVAVLLAYMRSRS